ncbi:hypothetical protein [Mangrovivirga cuniculi]|uniref:Uncharacterized protein n=1 Tax=Mangrovivirga cuniculi TaxID=2715131 RepID=A0A4D7JTL4_9BACT|nr:hypothetical protein [Mangrovivirga cuniculi]QCK16890.1 hypothetical protein DCC35_20210 [Mangrovivirga cuniculi]
MKFRLTSYRKQLWVSVSTGAFLFVVLYLYRSFGIQTNESFSGHSLFVRSVSFGLLTSLVFLINELLIAPFFSIDNFKKSIVWNVWEIFSAGTLSFLLFNYFWDWTELYLRGYFLMIFEFFIVMVIPVGVVNLLLNKKIHNNGHHSLINLKAENGKSQLTITSDKLFLLNLKIIMLMYSLNQMAN